MAARPMAYARPPPGFPPGMPGLPPGMPPGFPGSLPPGMPPGYVIHISTRIELIGQSTPTWIPSTPWIPRSYALPSWSDAPWVCTLSSI
jgi:hypothetical protein